MQTDILYLCSSSEIRKKLLLDAKIPFTCIPHHACEKSIEYNGSFEEYVLKIAQKKLSSINLETLEQKPNRLFLLASDTLVHGLISKKIYGKPKNLADATNIIKAISKEPLQVTTGCALAYYEKKDLTYQKKDSIIWQTGANVHFSIPDDEIATYLKKSPQALYAAGSTTIEEYGSRFVSSIDGSYTAVLGLPIFELSQNLKKLGFKEE